MKATPALSAVLICSSLGASAGLTATNLLEVSVHLGRTVQFDQSAASGPLDSGLLELDDPGFSPPPLQTGQGIADYGTLRGSLTGIELESQPGSGSFTAGFSDEITVNAPGLNGQVGTLTIMLAIDGTLNGADGSSASLFGDLANDAAEGFDFDDVSYSTDFTTPTVAIDDSMTLTVPYMIGTPAFFSASLQGSLNGIGTVNLLNTAGISGIQVLDPSSQPVTGSTITGSSGTNYTGLIVPEPAVLANLVFGALLLLRRRR